MAIPGIKVGRSHYSEIRHMLSQIREPSNAGAVCNLRLRSVDLLSVSDKALTCIMI